MTEEDMINTQVGEGSKEVNVLWTLGDNLYT